jgi:hypothetical protein
MMQDIPSIKYFAYGSNMPLARLKQRVPSAKFVGVYCLKAHDLRFHMASPDGSAKCDALYTENAEDYVWGVVFDMLISERPALDQAESLNVGYSDKISNVINQQGEQLEVLIYCALTIDDNLKPYSWYVNHVLMGAYENKLPAVYINKIKQVKYVEDNNQQRSLKEFEVHQ